MEREDVVDVNEVTVVGSEERSRFEIDPKSGLIGGLITATVIAASIGINKARKAIKQKIGKDDTDEGKVETAKPEEKATEDNTDSESEEETSETK